MDVVTSYERYTPEYTLHKRQYVPFMLKNIKVTPVPGDLEDTHLSECLQLIFIQDGKEFITNQGWVRETSSNVVTIHEAQGLTSATAIIVKSDSIMLQSWRFRDTSISAYL